MVLCILYSLGRQGAWSSGTEELEVYEAKVEGIDDQKIWGKTDEQVIFISLDE